MSCAFDLESGYTETRTCVECLAEYDTSTEDTGVLCSECLAEGWL